VGFICPIFLLLLVMEIYFNGRTNHWDILILILASLLSSSYLVIFFSLIWHFHEVSLNLAKSWLPLLSSSWPEMPQKTIIRFSLKKLRPLYLGGHTDYSWNIKWQKCTRIGFYGFILKKKDRILKQQKKSWEPFKSCLLNSTTNPAQNGWKLAALAVLFRRQLLNGSQDFSFNLVFQFSFIFLNKKPLRPMCAHFCHLLF
jgi:hypothetical protein